MERDQAGRRLRESFARAAAGRQKSIAAEAFPERSVAQAESEVSAILAGSRRPTWALLEQLLLAGPSAAVVLDAVCELAGARWEARPESEGASLARIADHVEQLELGLDAVREALGQVARERKPPIAKTLVQGRGKGVA